jgi:hypothetical protein
MPQLMPHLHFCFILQRGMSGIFTQLLVLSEEVQKGGGVEVEVES